MMKKEYADWEVETMAHGGYLAYAKSTGNKNFRGEEMPKWEDLPEQIRAAWVAATRSILAEADTRGSI